MLRWFRNLFRTLPVERSAVWSDPGTDEFDRATRDLEAGYNPYPKTDVQQQLLEVSAIADYWYRAALASTSRYLGLVAAIERTHAELTGAPEPDPEPSEAEVDTDLTWPTEFR